MTYQSLLAVKDFGVSINDIEFSVVKESKGFLGIGGKIEDRKLLRIEEEGVFVAPGKYLIELVKKTESKDIDFISYEDNSIKILADRSDFTLKGLDKDNYPIISFDESKTFITIDAANLKQIIRKSTFAASVSEARVILTGVSFQTSGAEMKVVSTDSYRLSRKLLVFDHEYPEIKIVIPAKCLDEFNKIVEEGEDVIEIHFSKTKAPAYLASIFAVSGAINCIFRVISLLLA